uniref:UDP-galactopyranose mutase n=1 Tax=uncultured Candidatus Melainabacteria bacterium TaxID=2682970 RepID=A0A650EIW5_9BACT|nr:UDP-galactopyranose mutase [uncultured Candidatus Melainabacteria bacterium]
MTENINLIVGAGISGSTLARKIADEAGEKVLLIDIKNHIGGNCFDYKDKNGITIHKYGSHIFHTNNQEVWSFLNQFTSFNTYMHKVYALIDGIKTTIPFNLNSLYDIFPKSMAYKFEKKLLNNFEYNSKIPILELKNTKDKDLNFLANFIYEKVFVNYTIKQWGVTPENIDPYVTSRVPVFISKDNRYFQDKYQGIPIDGYTKMIENIINHPNIETLLSTSYKDLKNISFKRIFYTGSIDEFFDYKLGKLPYRSVSFKIEESNLQYYQNNSVINYPNNYDFTRIHEYKYFLNEKSNKTIIAKEFSTDFQIGVNERYYPILRSENIEIYNEYKKIAKTYPNLYFLGRLGDYKYYDMDKSVSRAFEQFENIFAKVYTSNKEE